MGADAETGEVQRIAAALERIAVVLERAYPPLPKTGPEVSAESPSQPQQHNPYGGPLRQLINNPNDKAAKD